MVKLVNDGDFDCGFCSQKKLLSSGISSAGGISSVEVKPCARCIFPKIIEALERLK